MRCEGRPSGFGKKADLEDEDDAFKMDSFFACIAPLSNGFLMRDPLQSGPLSSGAAEFPNVMLQTLDYIS